MAEFHCRVASAAGDVFEKSFVAADETALRRDLESQDLMVLDVRRRNPVLAQLAKALRIRGNVSSREFLLFNQELSALIRAGLPIIATLDILLDRRKNETFRTALEDVRDRVKSGEALSDAFSAQGDLFPKLYSASLASGERSGEMATVIKRYIAYAQKVLAIRRKVVSAMIYPIILFTVSLLLILLLVFFIIPKFQAFLSDFGSDLPLITKIVVGAAEFCQNHWLMLLVGIGLTTAALLAWKRTPSGQLFFDTYKLRIPVLGTILDQYAQNRFTRTLGTLQAGGIPLVISLELSARAVGNALFEKNLLIVTRKVREGQSLWESLDEAALLSDIAVQMIKVGESTGSLVEMLENASDFTDEEIDTQLTRLVAMLEPLMLIFMAIIVAVMLMSIYLPLIQMYGGQSGDL